MNRIRSSMRRTLVAMISVLATLALALVPLSSAYAAQITGERLKSDMVPAVFGGRLHGVKTSTVDVEGKGTLSATIDYDTGIVTVQDFNGDIRTESLATLVKKIAEEINNLSEDQRHELKYSSQLRFNGHDVCQIAVGCIAYANGWAWSQAMALAAINPAVAALVGLGETFFWVWVSTHC